MDQAALQEVFEELFLSLENLETQNRAAMELLMDKGIVRQEEVVKYLDQASNASDVRWRAARARMNRLLASMEAIPEKPSPKKPANPTESTQENRHDSQEGSSVNPTEQNEKVEVVATPEPDSKNEREKQRPPRRESDDDKDAA
jgi:hypothetical protein